MTKTGRRLRQTAGYAAAVAAFLLRSERASGGPVGVAVEPTNRCNLSCPLCATGAGLLSRSSGTMTSDTFGRIIDGLPASVTDLYLWGQGEPFLAQGFLEMATKASSRGFRTVTSTNGHVLGDADGIIRSGLDTLIVSLDGADAGTYEHYRRGGDFKRVTKAIHALSDRKRALGAAHPIIEVQHLVTRETYPHLARFDVFARSIGADRVVFKTLQAASMPDGVAWLPDDRSSTRYHSDGNGNITTDRYPVLGSRCLRLYHSCQIDWEGNVVPCCFDKDSEQVLGNVLERPLAEIWNGEPYRLFRRRMNHEGRRLPMCRDCSEGLRRMTIRG